MKNEFAYIFELFTLLLGLAVAEMLSGFSGVLKLRARRKAGVDPTAHKVKIGWLVPLLGLLVLVDLATFWSLIWVGRGVMDMNMLTIFAVLVLIGGYYLVATLVFPDEPELWPDFDAYYWQQKRFVVLAMVVINVLAQGALIGLGAMDDVPTPDEMMKYPLFLVASQIVMLSLPLMIWLAFSKKRLVNIVLMVLIVAAQFFYAWAALGVPFLE
ncbi:hypothetical protein [Altererythrobacter sp. ZODW24]|uniref:hypothetical protein n=1 Tax=Altererythrobacter sp. ZODW24 TaxID=2185142 RepID=UPI000DF73346|nr:hypothetical protein [Altererythrobacter sp. ZODW24]